jgi:NO-binding membrane sensor protein with MHYT domain
VVTVHNFSNGILNPALAYSVSCLGAFLGLRCVTRARALDGVPRALWLTLAAVSVGATGIWAMHFIAMLGFTIQGQQIMYNVPVAIASMLLAILVVGVGLFIVGYGNGGWPRVASGGVIIGFGVAAMHYMGMDGMIMPDRVSYNGPLVVLSILIAIVAGTAALWAGTRVRGIGATIGASMIMGIAVCGMHYTGMEAMSFTPGSMSAMSGSTGFSFVVPLVIGLTVVTLVIALTISVARTEDEIAEDAVFRRRIDEFEAGWPGVATNTQSWARPGGRPTRYRGRLRSIGAIVRPYDAIAIASRRNCRGNQ